MISAAARGRRWSDENHYWGPFTYSKSTYKPISAVLDSGGEESHGCCLRMTAFGHAIIIELPPIIKPWMKWVDLTNREWATPGPDGKKGYWDIHSNEYGFSYSDGFLQIFLGPQTHDSDTTKSWSKFLPWTQWRHVRHSLYDTDGHHFWTEKKDSARLDGISAIQEYIEMKEACPSISFEFDDFDGERIIAKTHIEEREWKFGTGWFKWLSVFRRSKVRRSLDIEFSAETGERKGSWKGGTVGHSIDMKKGEPHEASFRRYCFKHNMRFVKRLAEVAK